MPVGVREGGRRLSGNGRHLAPAAGAHQAGDPGVGRHRWASVTIAWRATPVVLGPALEPPASGGRFGDGKSGREELTVARQR